MAFVAPWLNPPNFIGAMSAGASAGIAKRRADQEVTEAGDRLSLAYTQLASQEQRATEAVKAKHDLAKATMALKSRQLDSMDLYHRGQLDARAEADALRAANMQRLASQFDRNLEYKQGESEAQQGRFERVQKRLEQREADYPGKLSPATQALLQSDVSDLRSTQKAIHKIDEEGGPSSGILGFKSNKKQYADLKAREKELLDKIAGYETPKQKGKAAKYIYVPGKGIVASEE
jgi:hypothetical protein